MALPESVPLDVAPLRCWREGGIAHLRFNRPQAMNAIDLPMAQAFHQACRQVSADPAVRVLVLSGEGRAFMAGGDLQSMAADPAAVAAELIGEMHAGIELLADLAAMRNVLQQNADFTLIEGAGGFDGEAGDRPVGHGGIIDLGAGQALHVDQDQPLVGEDEDIADDLEGKRNLLAVDQHAVQAFGKIARVDARSMAQQSVEQSHRHPPVVWERDGEGARSRQDRFGPMAITPVRKRRCGC